MTNFHFGNLREEDGLPILNALASYIEDHETAANNRRFLTSTRRHLGDCADHGRDIVTRLRMPPEKQPVEAENHKAIAELLALFVIALETRMPTTTREIYEELRSADVTAMRTYVAKVRGGL
jgi:hypothetical protein